MKKRIAALLTAISLMFGLAACGQKQPDKYTTVSSQKKLDESKEAPTDEEICEKYSNFLKNYKVEYTNSYITNDEIDEHIDNALKKETCIFDITQYKDGEHYNIDKIINTIKNNSENYISNNPETSQAFFVINTSGDNIMELCKLRFEISFGISLKKIVETATNNIEEDLCNITNLRCVFVNNETYFKYNKQIKSKIDNYGLYIEEENLIIINEDNLIKLYNSADIAEFNNILNPVVYHLLNHVRQCNCNCNKKNKSYPFNYQGVTDNTIFYESSAESSYYNEYNGLYIDHNTFKQEQNDEKILFLLSIFSERNINDYYNAIYDGDINKLHNFFGLSNEEEIYEFYKIIYSIDGKNGNNGLLEKEESNKIDQNYKTSILKLMLNKMINYTYNNKDFKIEDNISLLSLINYIINYDYKENSNDEQYINNVYALNQEYIMFLKQYYNLSEDKMSYYISDFYLNKIIEEVSISNINNESLQQLPTLLEQFPNLKYVLDIDLSNGKSMNELIKSK